LNSSAATIVRTSHSLVAKRSFKVIETNRKSKEGVPLPTIYRPIPPVEWRFLDTCSPIPPVERAPNSNESSPVPPVKWGKPVPNGTLEAHCVQESLSLHDCSQGVQESRSAASAGTEKIKGLPANAVRVRRV
jgi:hypothetical protein